VATGRFAVGNYHAYFWHHRNDFPPDTQLRNRYLSHHRRNMGNCIQSVIFKRPVVDDDTGEPGGQTAPLARWIK
jgi:hypothetical protein